MGEAKCLTHIELYIMNYSNDENCKRRAMMRSIKQLVMIISLGCIAGLYAQTTQFRAPLINFERGVFHYPLDLVDETWWYELHEGDCCKETCWYADTWSSYYYRSANKAFIDDCDPGKITRDTVPLSQLFFGKSSFRAEDAFPGGLLTPDVNDACRNAALSYARLTPDFTYSEKGAYFGVHAWKTFGCDCEYRYGFRASLPFKIIQTEQAACGIEETLNDVFCECCYNTDADANITQTDFAYRLDFLSTLIRCGLPTQGNLLPSRPIVQYSPVIDDTQNMTQIAGIPVGFPQGTAITGFPVYLIKQSDGNCPAPTQTTPNYPKKSWAKTADKVTGFLPASGAASDGAVLAFNDASVNYKANLGADRDTQGTLFLVGQANATNGLPEEIVSQATAIRNAISSLVYNGGIGLQETVAEFFKNKCVDICASERIAALGDLETEFYVGQLTDYWFANAITGLRFPTGKRIDDCRRLYAQSPGHNGHFEFKLGLEGGVQPLDCFAIRADIFWKHAFKRTECKVAPFEGATVRNFGATCVDATVSWDYFDAHFDLNFFHPCNADLGFVIGYNLFAKRDDKVSICQNSATDCFGTTADLDATLLERNTNSMLHIIHGEVFHRWSFFEILAGASQALAGRQAMKETEVYVSLSIWF